MTIREHSGHPPSRPGTLQTAACADLTELRGSLRARISGARCLIVGSAPDAVSPELSGIDVAICINGSPWVARSMGVAKPDVTVVAGYATRDDTEVRRATVNALKGLSTRDLLFIEAGQDAERGRSVLDSAGFGYDRFRAIGIADRAAIIIEICGLPLGTGPRDGRISNGMFAVVLALWAGASSIVLAGFSLTGGHAYMSGVTPRHHCDGDRRFLHFVSGLGNRVSTTTAELQAEFGIGRAQANAPGVVPRC